jgi:hypothetical protein
MKLAWLCWPSNGWYANEDGPIILFEEPEKYKYDKVVPIVYMEIING